MRLSLKRPTYMRCRVCRYFTNDEEVDKQVEDHIMWKKIILRNLIHAIKSNSIKCLIFNHHILYIHPPSSGRVYIQYVMGGCIYSMWWEGVYNMCITLQSTYTVYTVYLLQLTSLIFLQGTCWFF